MKHKSESGTSQGFCERERRHEAVGSTNIVLSVLPVCGPIYLMDGGGREVPSSGCDDSVGWAAPRGRGVLPEQQHYSYADASVYRKRADWRVSSQGMWPLATGEK